MAHRKQSYDAFLNHQASRLRGDAGGVLFERLTRATMSELVEYVYDETPWASEELITTVTDVSPGKTSIDWFAARDIAAPGDGFVGDDGPIPFADFELEPNNVRVHTVLNGYRYTLQEAESWAEQGFSISLPQRKAQASAHKWHIDVDTAWRDGIAGKFEGVLNYPGSQQLIAGTTPGTIAAWETTATPDQIVNSMATMRKAFDTAGPGLRPDTVVLPSAVEARLTTDLRSTSSDTTIFGFLQANMRGITKWRFDRAMNTAGIGGTPCVLMYDRRPTTLWAWMPRRMEPLQEFVKHTEFQQGFRTRVTGPVCEHPRSIVRLSGV